MCFDGRGFRQADRAEARLLQRWDREAAAAKKFAFALDSDRLGR